MDAPTPTRDDPRLRWSQAQDAVRYGGQRFATARARQRDPRLVARVLAALDLPPDARVLDAPCGTGRLREAVEGAAGWLGLDVSRPMLEAGGGPRLQGDVLHLPFKDDAFAAVLSCRFLHHLRSDAVFDRAVRELVRVSSHYVIASFWDRSSLPELRGRVRGLLVPPGRRRRDARIARPRSEVRHAFLEAGARDVDFRAVLRFVSRQTFCVARLG